MINFEFTKEEIEALSYERFHHPHPRVQRKMEAVFLKSHNLPHQDICCFADISGNTLRSYLKDYQEGGINKLKEINFYKPQSEMTEYKSSIEAYFKEHPPASIKEAMAKIEELTGIHRSENRVREFLESIGLKRRKVGMIPAKADPDKQEVFLKNELEPRISEAKEGKRAVFSVDASHFVLAPFLGFLWSFARIFIQAPAGRQRFNVLAALNIITHELITVCNDEYINALSFCDLLSKIAEINLQIPVTIVLDNARYQKCRIVNELAVSLNIGLLYLPAYSPNLNLIGRLWKFIKKKCLWSKYYPNFQEFKTAISSCLNQTHTTYKNELDSLLTLNFQSFKKAQIMTV
ncbi:MAG: IS630 family transposase [Desulfococcaceae bacterium]